MRIGIRIMLSFCLVSAVGAAPPEPSMESLDALMAEGKYAEAEAAAQELVTAVETERGVDSPQVAEVLDVLLEARWRGGKADDQTVEIGTRALEIKRRALGSDHAGVGKTMHHLAVVAFFRNEYGTARDRWAEAIDIRSRALGADHPDIAESLNGQANLVWTMGDLAEAERLFDRALEIREKAYGAEDPRVSVVRSNLFTLMSAQGRYAEALELGEQCAELDERSLGPDHPELASTLTNLADVYDKTGDRVTARKMYERVIAIWKKSLGEDHYLVGTAMNNLAEQLRRSGDHAEARQLFEQALSLWEKGLGPDSPRVGLCLNNMALLAKDAGDLDEAALLAERSARVRESGLGADHPELSDSLHLLGVLRTSAGNLEKARPVLQRALGIRRQSLGATHPFVAETQIALAELQIRAGNGTSALKLALESERIARDHLRLTGSSLAEEHALSYAATRDRGLDLAISIVVTAGDRTRSVLDELVRSRAVVLDEMATRHRSARVSADPEIARLSTELVEARARLANLTVRGVGDLDAETYRQFVDEARQVKDRAERALGSASREFAAEQRRTQLGLDEVIANLPEGGALVSFVLYEHLSVPAPGDPDPNAIDRASSYAAVIAKSGDSEPFAVKLGSAEDLDRRVARWKREVARGSLRGSETSYHKAALELRKRIWDPIVGSLEGVERVFIVPDGSLNLVSFAALPAGDDNYLIETGPQLHYLSAERDLVPDTDEAETGTGLLALGGPNYDATSMFAALTAEDKATTHVAASSSRSANCGDFRTLSFKPLPAAGKEADEVVALWKETFSSQDDPDASALHLSGAEASEGAFKNQAGGRRVLHVATHGFFLGGDCTDSPGGDRGLTVVKEKPAPQVPGMRLSPLLLSGLAMAGANQRVAAGPDEEDGVLTAEEIAALDLSGVEWAVLSACDTGVGEIHAGEGVFGLRRAIQVAGVRTLIMSLWPVDDEATRQWMSALYAGRLSQGMDTATAVRQAGINVLNARRDAGESTHPFYWAAFAAAGDWR